MKKLLKQFGGNLISIESDCPIGYIKSNCKLTICSSADMDEVWKSGLKGENVTLWCYAPRHKNDSDDSDSDEGMTKPSKEAPETNCTGREKVESRVNNIIIAGKTWQQINYYSIQTGGE